jgi:hypothetical protein
VLFPFGLIHRAKLDGVRPGTEASSMGVWESTRKICETGVWAVKDAFGRVHFFVLLEEPFALQGKAFPGFGHFQKLIAVFVVARTPRKGATFFRVLPVLTSLFHEVQSLDPRYRER